MQPNSLNAYMLQIEQSIGGAFYNDKLSVHLAGGIQGPHCLSFAIRLYQPTKANVAKALALGPAIEACTGVSSVRVYADHGHIMIEVPSPVPVTIYGRSLKGQGLAVPVGMGSRRSVIGVDFEKSPHLLVTGPTNAGKTTAARGVAYQLARQNSPRHCRFIFSTFKPKDWRSFATVAHCMAVISDPTESATMIAWLTRLMYERVKQEVDRPHLFVFVDDLLNLLGATAGEVTKDLRELASLGRGCGIHLLIGTQRLGEMGAGGAAITGNIRSRLVFGTADAQDAALFTGRGESGAEKLGQYPGDCLLVNNGSTQRLAVALVTDQDVAKLPQSDISARPWQRELQDKEAVRTGSMMEGAVGAILGVETPLFTEPVPDGSTPVEGGSKPLLNGPAKTTLEREMVLKIHARTGSKNQTYKLVWGYKNGDTQQWLNEILQGEA